MGVSVLLGLSVEGFGLLPHANLILHSRFGASAVGTLVGPAAVSGLGAMGLATGSFLPPHAKLMHRFFGGASTGGLVVGDTLTLATISGEIGIAGSAFAAGMVRGNGDFAAANEYGAKLVYVAFGRGGLGVFVRAGLVNPPSLVSSAVEARLALLIIDLRRDKSVATCISGFVSASGLWSALVRSDSVRSDLGRIVDL